jgi:hypothetical protein
MNSRRCIAILNVQNWRRNKALTNHSARRSLRASR